MSTADFNAIAVATGTTVFAVTVTYLVLTNLSSVATALKATYEWMVKDPIRILAAVSIAIVYLVWP
jgi:hypothetical protein